jgi:hypothetical protein
MLCCSNVVHAHLTGLKFYGPGCTKVRHSIVLVLYYYINDQSSVRPEGRMGNNKQQKSSAMGTQRALAAALMDEHWQDVAQGFNYM